MTFEQSRCFECNGRQTKWSRTFSVSWMICTCRRSTLAPWLGEQSAESLSEIGFDVSETESMIGGRDHPSRSVSSWMPPPASDDDAFAGQSLIALEMLADHVDIIETSFAKR